MEAMLPIASLTYWTGPRPGMALFELERMPTLSGGRLLPGGGVSELSTDFAVAAALASRALLADPAILLTASRTPRGRLGSAGSGATSADTLTACMPSTLVDRADGVSNAALCS